MKWTGWSSEVVPQMRTIDFEQDTRLVQYEGKVILVINWMRYLPLFPCKTQLKLDENLM